MALRCLVVDDSARFLESARLLLETQGVRVDVASTGAEAARLVDESHPDVVLLDIDLGGESGFEVARRLVVTEGGGVSIILLSTHSGRDFEELIDASPALGFLSKSDLSAEAIHQVLHGQV